MSRSLVGSSSTSTVAGAGEQGGPAAGGCAHRPRGPHRRMRMGGREQKVAQVAAHMLALSVDLDPLAAGADEVFQRGVRSIASRSWSKVGHLQVGAAADGAAVRFQLAQNHLEQRGLARAVGAQQANLVAAQQCGAEVAGNHLVAKALLTCCSSATILPWWLLSPPVPTSIFTLPTTSRRAARVSRNWVPGDQCGWLQVRALPRPCAPHFFLRQQLVGLGVDDGFLRQLLFPFAGGRRQSCRARAQLAPMIHRRCGCNAVKRRSWVMVTTLPLEVDEQVSSQRMESRSGGWWVHQAAAHRAGPPAPGPGHALFGAARGRPHDVWVQVQALGFLPRVAPQFRRRRFDLGLQGVQVRHRRGPGRYSRKAITPASPADAAWKMVASGSSAGSCSTKAMRVPCCACSVPSSGLGQPAQDFEQRRLARAVAADQADAFMVSKGKAGVVQQSDMPESQLGIGRVIRAMGGLSGGALAGCSEGLPPNATIALPYKFLTNWLWAGATPAPAALRGATASSRSSQACPCWALPWGGGAHHRAERDERLSKEVRDRMLSVVSHIGSSRPQGGAMPTRPDAGRGPAQPLTWWAQRPLCRPRRCWRVAKT